MTDHVSRFRAHRTIRLLAALGAALGATACASGTTSRMESGGEVALPAATSADRSMETMLAGWPAMPREAAAMLTTKYGQPDLAGDRTLVWYNKGPYVKIALSRDEQPHNFPMPHTDFLTSTVKHNVPADKMDDLYEYDGSVWFHRTRGELSAQCDKEELNNLALNLAHDVAMGKRTVQDARMFYAKTAMEFKAGNMSSPYLTGLTFQPMANSADADKPADMAGMK